MSAAWAERFGAALDRARTYDRALLTIAAILFALGILFSMAASPAATARIRIEEAFYFAGRQTAYAMLGVAVMLAAAALDPRQLRRFATIVAGAALIMCVLVALFAPEIKGARRWFDLGFTSIQPSEILKPTIVVFWAWMLGESMKRSDFPGRWIALVGIVLTGVMALASRSRPRT